MTAIYNGASDTMARLSWPLARQATVAVGLVLALLALGAEIARYIGLGVTAGIILSGKGGEAKIRAGDQIEVSRGLR